MPKRRKIDPTQLAPSAATSNPEKQQCFLFYISGFQPSEIEEQTKVPSNRIRQWMHLEKWKQQRDQLEDYRRKKNPPAEQPMVKRVINGDRGQLKREFIAKTGKMAIDDVTHWDTLKPEKRLAVAPAIAALNGVHRKNLGLEDEDESKERGHIHLTFLRTANEPGMVRMLKDAKPAATMPETAEELPAPVATLPATPETPAYNLDDF